MTRGTSGSRSVERLADDLLADGDGPFASELVAWLTTSARFRSFADANQAKIRKKLRGARNDDDALRDVRAELRVAALLLADRRIDVAYEAYGSGRSGPDFTISYRATRTFNVEVTRPRRAHDTSGLATSIAAKLRQLPPSVPNVLVLAMGGGSATSLDIAAANRWLRARAEAGDEDFLAANGLSGMRGFNDRYLRLGAVIAWDEVASTANDRATLWTNPSARIALDARAANACIVCLQASLP